MAAKNTNIRKSLLGLTAACLTMRGAISLLELKKMDPFKDNYDKERKLRKTAIISFGAAAIMVTLIYAPKLEIDLK